MNEHEALVERVAKALCKKAHGAYDADVVAEQAIDAILDGNTLIVGGGPGGLVRVGEIGDSGWEFWMLVPLAEEADRG